MSYNNLPTFGLGALIRRSGHYNFMKSVDLVASGPYWNATAYEQNEVLKFANFVTREIRENKTTQILKMQPNAQ